MTFAKKMIPAAVHWAIVAAPMVACAAAWTLFGWLGCAATTILVLRQILDHTTGKTTLQRDAPLKKKKKKKRVAVIGAGPAGLATAKELLEAGHDVTVFEKAATVGGTFAHGFYENGVLTSSPFVTGFSDFQPKETRHQTADEYVRYLEDYARHYGVFGTIRFGAEVGHICKVVRGDEVKIRLVVKGAAPVQEEEEEEEESSSFDHVSVCVGLHNPESKFVPDVEGAHLLPKDKILHGSQFRSAKPFAGKRVLLVGLSETSSDVAADVADVASAAWIAVRRGGFVIPRTNPLTGLPNDLDSTRLRYALPKTVHCLSMWLCAFLNRVCGNAAPASALRYDLVHARLPSLPGQVSAVKSDRVVQSVTKGKCALCYAGVRRFVAKKTGERVVHSAVLADGTVLEDLDAVIFCTGYRGLPLAKLLGCDALFDDGPEKSCCCVTHLYQRIFHPATRDALSFVGLARPLIGAIPPIAELQARLVAAVVSGDVALPSSDAMRKDAARDALQRKRDFGGHVEGWQSPCNWIPYMDSLALAVGCMPSATSLFFQGHWKLLFSLVAGPMVPPQYRLHGPGAKPDLAHAFYDALPATASRKRDLLFYAALHLSCWLLPFYSRDPSRSCRLL